MGQPLYLHLGNSGRFISTNGTAGRFPNQDSLIINRDVLEESFRAICGYGVHTHQNELKNGYVTLKGGHRAGICGTGVYTQSQLSGMRDISSINIRIARQVIGCADPILSRWINRTGGILLAGPPASGKTTILRDLARQMGSGRVTRMQKITVIDERGEIAAMVGGIAQNDLGFCTDVLNGVSKSEGISMAVRTLSPNVIFCDEIGSEQEIQPIAEAMAAGVMLVATAHSGSFSDLCRKPAMARLLQMGLFDAVVVLDTEERVGEIKEWYDREDMNHEMDRFYAGGSGLCGDRPMDGQSGASQGAGAGMLHFVG